MVLISCSEGQSTLSDYESYQVKIAKKKFTSNNGEFSISLPHDWYVNEDPIVSDTVLYIMESSSTSHEILGIGIAKMNLIFNNIDNEFDEVIKKVTTQASNVKLVEKSQLKIKERTARTALLSYEQDGSIIQEEIYVFIPINDSQYYHIGLVCDKNEKSEHNFGMMIGCVKSFNLEE